ncbi:uncharacterized protein LOC124705983 [Lolium rigidum]|uniref:uncharacterized protein LOC124705983 n=1 Tax=Lolium rigidum TaxID=89674 RepID=UPI001F5D10AD|nr:uncharacterized protein LOC124705983 [Lolium rigidum]
MIQGMWDVEQDSLDENGCYLKVYILLSLSRREPYLEVPLNHRCSVLALVMALFRSALNLQGQQGRSGAGQEGAMVMAVFAVVRPGLHCVLTSTTCNRVDEQVRAHRQSTLYIVASMVLKASPRRRLSDA